MCDKNDSYMSVVILVEVPLSFSRKFGPWAQLSAEAFVLVVGSYKAFVEGCLPFLPACSIWSAGGGPIYRLVDGRLVVFVAAVWYQVFSIAGCDIG
jgi:hypothetical protein